MKKLLITLTVALLIIPTVAFAQEGKVEALRAALNAKFSPSIEAPQAKSAEPQTVLASILYLWGANFTYQASSDGWWSGLVINAGGPVDIKVRLLDSNGSATGEGTFFLGLSNQQSVGMLKDMISTGYVPERGSVFVYGNNSFSTTLVVGNSDGGFGMIEKEAVSFLP